MGLISPSAFFVKEVLSRQSITKLVENFNVFGKVPLYYIDSNQRWLQKEVHRKNGTEALQGKEQVNAITGNPPLASLARRPPRR